MGEKLEANSDRFKVVNISDRQKRKRKMLINELKSGVSALAETQVVTSQKDVSLNSSSNAVDTLSQGKKKKIERVMKWSIGLKQQGNQLISIIL